MAPGRQAATLEVWRSQSSPFRCFFYKSVATQREPCNKAETNSEFQGLQSLKTHDFVVLLRFSGVEDTVKTTYLAEWSTMKLWKPELRYAKTGSADTTTATAMIDAAQKLLRVL